jgi:hypothetical protein
MTCVGFELMVPASERVKTVHALDLSATVIGKRSIYGKMFPIKVDDLHEVYIWAVP